MQDSQLRTIIRARGEGDCQPRNEDEDEDEDEAPALPRSEQLPPACAGPAMERSRCRRVGAGTQQMSADVPHGRTCGTRAPEGAEGARGRQRPSKSI